MRQLADGDGDVTLAQGYTPFGVLLWREGDAASGYGFTGEQEDVAVGLVFLRARYYDPTTGRFISKDPWPGSLRRPGTLNFYVYVLNNAPNGTDPSGNICIFGFGNCDEEIDLATVAVNLPYFVFQKDFCLPGDLGCWGGLKHGMENVIRLNSDKFAEEMYWTWYHPTQA